jgi:uncharacterized protein
VTVIDGDGHVLEPRAAWREMSEAHRPRIVTDERGLDHVIVGDAHVFLAKLGQMGSPGSDVSKPSTEPVPLESARAGAFDGRERLADMDAEGIDVAVLYPTIGLGFWGIPDAEAAVACARAYNDWLASYCAVAPSRLHGAAMVPFQDPDAAVRELRRAREELGFVAVFVRPNPCLGRSLVDDAYEPFWAAAEELGVAVGVHEGFQPAVPPLATDRTRNILVLHAVSHTFEQMLACALLIADGVMERHPSLRFVFLEAGGGWVPYWLGRLDHQVASYGGYAPRMRLTPSEYFARQCWISFELDEATLPALASHVGVDRIVWGSDYPHADSTFPGAVAELQATIAPLPAADQRRVLGENARVLYGIA